jgi:cell division protein FtsB
VLYDPLIHLGYGGDIAIYRCRLSMVDSLNISETSVMIPLNPAEPWTGTVVSNEPDTTVEQIAHITLTALCESRLATTIMMPIALFLIRNKEYPMWKKHLEAMSDLEDPHFDIDIAAMAKYTQYLFNLQHNTARTIMQQRMRLAAYDEHNAAISHELEKLKHENALLRNGTFPPSDQDRELNVMYCRLSEAKHGSNYARQQLDVTHEEVDSGTHAIIHLEHANEQQDLELEERAALITSLEQQI